jgi:hypothetical protein
MKMLFETNVERMNAIEALKPAQGDKAYFTKQNLIQHIIREVPADLLIMKYLIDLPGDNLVSHLYILDKLREKGTNHKALFNRWIKNIHKMGKPSQIKIAGILQSVSMMLPPAYEKRLFNYMIKSGIKENISRSAWMASKYWKNGLSTVYYKSFLKTKNDSLLKPVIENNPDYIAKRMKQIWNTKTDGGEFFHTELIGALGHSHYECFAFLEYTDGWSYYLVSKESQKKLTLKQLEKIAAAVNEEKQAELMSYIADCGYTELADKLCKRLLKKYLPGKPN